MTLEINLDDYLSEEAFALTEDHDAFVFDEIKDAIAEFNDTMADIAANNGLAIAYSVHESEVGIQIDEDEIYLKKT